MRLFDAYLMVDWSASNKAKTGKDSIWWCLVDAQGEGCDIRSTSNPATRDQATAEIRQVLLDFALSDRRILVGFDFAYGYPQGFAHLLGLSGQKLWLKVWRELAARIEDHRNNSNNRFEVASHLNREITGLDAPFWGCPVNQVDEYLRRHKPGSDESLGLKELRMAERRARAHSTWKLFYAGAVGSQVLMGIPRLYKLRTDPELEQISCVWPFETGLRTLDMEVLAGKRIIHAEIYPSLITIEPEAEEVKDQRQVQDLGLYFAKLDQEGVLKELFVGDPRLSEEEKKWLNSRKAGYSVSGNLWLIRGWVDMLKRRRLTNTGAESK